MVLTIGVDLGSQKCMLVADDADIVLTDTGSISRPTLVSFFGKSRLVGEEAAPQVLVFTRNIPHKNNSFKRFTVEISHVHAPYSILDFWGVYDTNDQSSVW